MNRRMLLGLPLLLALVAAGWSMRSTAPSPSASQPPPSVSLGLREGSIILRHEGVRQAEIHARRVTVSADLSSARLSGITRATIFDRGEAALELDAQEIVMDRRTNDLEIRGPLVVTSPRGYRLAAPTALWRHAVRQIVFPRGVYITLGHDEIHAGSLVIDSTLQTFDLAGGVDIAFRLGGAQR